MKAIPSIHSTSHRALPDWIRVLLPVAICLLVLASRVQACSDRSAAGDSRHFASVESAIPGIDRMLRGEDWPGLARYYELSGSTVPRSKLESGEFFVRKERPKFAHPSSSWKYRHPFPPGWKLLRIQPMQGADRVEVVMGVDIDQGDGRTQRGMTEFMMRRSAGGWQILPPLNGTARNQNEHADSPVAGPTSSNNLREQKARRKSEHFPERFDEHLVRQAIAAGCDEARATRLREAFRDFRIAEGKIMEAGLERCVPISQWHEKQRTLREILTPREFMALNEKEAESRAASDTKKKPAPPPGVRCKLLVSAGEYDPSAPAGVIKCIVINNSTKPVSLHVGYDGLTNTLMGWNADQKDWDLHSCERPNTFTNWILLKPGQQQAAFELSLDEILNQCVRKPGAVDASKWYWRSAAHPMPPCSPIHRCSGECGFFDKVRFRAEVFIDGFERSSEDVVLNIRPT